MGNSAGHCSINEKHRSAKPSAHTAISCIYYANARARKLGTPTYAWPRVACARAAAGDISQKLYACALFIIDGLGHATWSSTMPVSRSRTASF